MFKQINICISASDKYIELGVIMLYSVVYHAKPNTSFSFYIIDNGITEQKRGMVRKFFENYDVNIIFINANNIEKDVGMKIDPGRWTLSTLQRLYISSFLPEEVHRILYLDCDMLVRGPLDELYDIDLGDECILAGAIDYISEQNKKNIGLSREDIYVNVGMLVIDVDRWRRYDVGEKCLKFLVDNIEHLQFFDQDIINAVLKDKIKSVPLKYNAYTLLFNYQYSEVLKYRNIEELCAVKEYKEAISNPVIVHFTQDTISVRPWYTNGNHKFKNEWLSMRNATPWREEPLWKDDRPISIKVKYIIFKLLPRKMAVLIAGKVNKKHALDYQ